ncbi:MAG: FlgO family outer membrane protein [Rhodoferax sp.]|nr:FlgO family outer membrane protein [Rhodoferax sp.]MDD2925231.1 FlgO family outer membrane protein [Rhodoferax sp.]
MMRYTLTLCACAAALLAGCTTSTPTRLEPTYAEAASSQFVTANREAINKLVAGFDLNATGGHPVLVATIVNVNDLRRSAPLGRTLSEQYASHMVGAGFNVKEMKLRGDVFVKEETGELLLSREIKDIARSHHAAYVLVGTYSAAASFTYVSLKFVRTEDGSIIRAHDYALPNDKDIVKLLQVTTSR